MEMVYFLLFIGACIVTVSLVAWKSKSKKDLARRRSQKSFRPPSEALLMTTDSRLVDKNEIWRARQKHAAQDLRSATPFIPKSELEAEPVYDGYSRRDRHHLTKQARVKGYGSTNGLIKGKEAIEATDLGQDVDIRGTNQAAQT